MMRSRDRTVWTSPLVAAGWHLKDTCNCGGVYREEWGHESFKGWEVWIYPDKSALFSARFILYFYSIARLRKKLEELSHTLQTYEKFQPV